MHSCKLSGEEPVSIGAPSREPANPYWRWTTPISPSIFSRRSATSGYPRARKNWTTGCVRIHEREQSASPTPGRLEESNADLAEQATENGRTRLSGDLDTKAPL